MANTAGSHYDLLPPNSTQLERDFSRSISSLVRTAAPVPIIRTAKRINIPGSVVPWLVYEYGLGEVTDFITDLRRVIHEGVDWQRIRGTPAAILIGLSWLDLNDAIVDEQEGGSDKWAQFQIGLVAPTFGEPILRQIMTVARISAPVRSPLQRIFAVWDHRRFILDWTMLSSGSPLSDHTGERPFGGDPQVSYGDFRKYLLDASPDIHSVLTWCRASIVIYPWRFILDEWCQLDEWWHTLNNPVARTDYFSTWILQSSIIDLLGTDVFRLDDSWLSSEFNLSDGTGINDTSPTGGTGISIQIPAGLPFQLDHSLMDGETTLSDGYLELTVTMPGDNEWNDIPWPDEPWSTGREQVSGAMTTIVIPPATFSLTTEAGVFEIS